MAEVRLSDITATLRRLRSQAEKLDPRLMDGQTAKKILEETAETECALASLRTRAAHRVDETNAWKRSGHKSAAHLLAASTGTTVKAAVDVLQTAEKLDELPELREAFQTGSVSEDQAREIASAASADPGTERELLLVAEREGLTTLKKQCRAVRSAASSAGEERERHERIHQRRHFRHWTDGDGAFRFTGSVTADAGGRLFAVIDKEISRLARLARENGRRENGDALAADALVNVATRTPKGDSAQSGPPTTVIVRVDHPALMRGHTKTGEVCEIDGIGPIPVATARSLAEDTYLHVLVTKGADVVATANGGQTIPASVRRIVIERDRECIVPGCHETNHLEIDHTKPKAEGGPPTPENLARLCNWHHYLKTHHGHTYTGPPGNRQWHPPP